MMPEIPRLEHQSGLENQFSIGVRHERLEMDVLVHSEAAEVMVDALTTMGQYYNEQLADSSVAEDSQQIARFTRKAKICQQLSTRLRGRQPYEEGEDLRNLRQGLLGRTAIIDENTPSIDDAKRQPPRTESVVLTDAQVDFVLDALTDAPDVLVARAYEMHTAGPPETPRYDKDTPDALEKRQLATAQVRTSWSEQIAELHNRAQAMRTITEIAGAPGLPEDGEAPTDPGAPHA